MNNILEFVSYDAETGAFTWIKSPRNSRIIIGDKLSCVGTDGHAYAKICGKIYRLSKLAWWFVHGNYPPRCEQLNFSNGNKLDLRICNLSLKKDKQIKFCRQDLLNWFDYCPESGILKRKLAFHNRDVGSVCGSYCKDGYLQTSWFNVTYRVHRIIWTMINGDIPFGMEIDHINRIRDDNRLINLRLADDSLNAQNKDWEVWYHNWYLNRHGKVPTDKQLSAMIERHK